ncbi:MAG: serine/threonine protein kinase [Aureliella sp.]
MSETAVDLTNDQLAPNDSLSELFLHEHRLGLVDDIQTFCERFPGERERIQREFPQLLDLECAYRQLLDDKPDIPGCIGKYALGEEIGRGGMGYVHAALHPDLEIDLAIKLLPVDGLYPQRSLKRFHAEARACAVMDHANIVPVYDYGLEGRFAYFVMRRINGKSLADIVKSSCELSWEAITEIGLQASSALEYAHKHGTIHRDVKPANLMLEESGKLWLGDFGVAKLAEDHSGIRKQTELTMTGELVGTARYMAPERLSGICTPICDIYGLGLTLYELAAGRRVWADIEELATLTERPALPDVREFNSQVPTELSKIIMKACSFRPEERYQSAAELEYVLRRFSRGNAKADRRSINNISRKRWFRKDVLVESSIALAILTVSVSAYVISSVRESSRASAEQIADTLKGKLSNPWQNVEGESIFDSEDREVRSALMDFVKAVAFSEIDSEADREAASKALDDVAAIYVDSGVEAYEAYESKQLDQEGSVWSKIPPLLARIEQSHLNPAWKEYGSRILSIMSNEDATGHLTGTKRELFQTAFEELNNASPPGGQANEAERVALRKFIQELGRIELFEDINSLRNKLTPPAQETASPIRDQMDAATP